MQERCHESGSCVQKNCASLGVHPRGSPHFQGPTGVQNSPNCLAELRRDLLSILANHMSIDCLRDWRSVRVTESLLTQFLGCSETVHQSCIRMTEGVEAIATGQLNA